MNNSQNSTDLLLLSMALVTTNAANFIYCVVPLNLIGGALGQEIKVPFIVSLGAVVYLYFGARKFLEMKSKGSMPSKILKATLLTPFWPYFTK